MKLPTRSATAAHLRKGSLIMLHSSAYEIGGRPRPGFVELRGAGETRFIRASTKVSVLSSGKAE
jgi:hypothetical protein